ETLHEWHWISSALSLIGILLFAITGITLNHASQIEGKPVVTTLKAQLPEQVRNELATIESEDKPPVPAYLRDAIKELTDVRVGDRIAEWSDSEVYISMPRAGGDAWLNI